MAFKEEGGGDVVNYSWKYPKSHYSSTLFQNHGGQCWGSVSLGSLCRGRMMVAVQSPWSYPLQRTKSFFILNKVFCMALWEAPSPLCRPSCTSELHSWHTSSFVAEGVGYITPTASTILWAYEVHLYSSDSSGGFCYLALVVKSSGTLSHLQNG